MAVPNVPAGMSLTVISSGEHNNSGLRSLLVDVDKVSVVVEHPAAGFVHQLAPRVVGYHFHCRCHLLWLLAPAFIVCLQQQSDLSMLQSLALGLFYQLSTLQTSMTMTENDMTEGIECSGVMLPAEIF